MGPNGVDPIDALKLELLCYPGIELECIREEGQVVHEDQELGEQIVMDLLSQNLLMLVFKGPATGVSDQPTRLALTVPPEFIRDPVFCSGLADKVAEDFERAIQDNAVSEASG